MPEKRHAEDREEVGEQRAGDDKRTRVDADAGNGGGSEPVRAATLAQGPEEEGEEGELILTGEPSPEDDKDKRRKDKKEKARHSLAAAASGIFLSRSPHRCE